MRLWCDACERVEELTETAVEKLVYGLQAWPNVGEPVCLIGLAETGDRTYVDRWATRVLRRREGGRAYTGRRGGQE